MHQRTIGSLTVSAIGLGCMNMSMGYGPADDATSIRLMNLALDTGYTFLDTAMMYGDGHNEMLIGKALSERRNDYVLATKCGLTSEKIDGRPEEITGHCEASLKRLQTDVIDLYYLHRMDPEVSIEDSVGAMSRLVEQGKVRELGLSEVSASSLKRAHVVHPIAALQSEYSLWSRTPERRIMATCKDLGVVIVPFSPLGRAFLTGKACNVTKLDETDIRSTIARPRFEPDAFAQNKKLWKPLAAIAAANDCSMAQLALAWTLARQDRTMVPIPGTKHIEYMEENGQASEIKLDKATVSALDDLVNETTVIGNRYTDAGMTKADSERD